MGEAFEQHEQGETVLYGACAGIWIMIMFAPPTKADMLLARPSLATMKRREPHPFPSLAWVLTEAGYRMDADARGAATDTTREYAASLVAQATLVEGAGFQGAAVRGILAGIDALSRTASPKKVFGELAPAVDYCLKARAKGSPRMEASIAVRSLEETRSGVLSRVGQRV